MGFGFWEKVYENALKCELEIEGLEVERQKPIKVFYKEKMVGEYFAGLVVSKKVVIELKAAEILFGEHELQLINYLKAINFELGLLLNFGRKPEIRRKIFSNSLRKFV